MALRAFDSVLFDLDGTLWDASEACAQAWIRSLAAFGWPGRTVNAAQARRFTGLPFEVIFERWFPELPAERHREFITLYRYHEALVFQAQGGTVYPGVRETLERLRPSLRLFVVSNCQDGYIENFFRLTGLGSFFEGYESLGRTGKPKAENLRAVVSEYGLKAPLYVGDTAHDFEAARGNGLPFVWASYGFGSAPEADFSIARFAALTPLVLPPRAVIFDMDGTLVDNLPAHLQAWKGLLAEHGLHLTEAEIDARNHGNIDAIVRRFFGDDLPVDRVKALGQAKEAAYRRLFAAHLKETPGLRAVLEGMTRLGIRAGLATMGDALNIEFVVEGLGLGQYFEAITGGHEVTQGKPNPEVYRSVLSKLGLEASDCLAVEDTAGGVQAARAAGLTVVGITTSLTAHALHEAGCAQVIGDFHGLARLLGIVSSTTKLSPTSADFWDDFDTPQLDLTKWLPVYLPQWSSAAATRPRYRLESSQLILTIEADQRPWSPEFNGPVRVSNLQTGVWSGPLGSPLGQHHFTPGLLVREEQETRQTFTPLYGAIEFRCRCRLGRSHVAALWMIGLEDEPQRSAELCLFELKGSNLRPSSATIGSGLRAFADPALHDEFFEEEFFIDVSEWHTWRVDWTESGLAFFVDGAQIRTVHQSPNYPMQLMLNLYDLGAPTETNATPPEFCVDWVRGLANRA